jgi:osmotically-inducible protein OsmY
MHDESMNPGSAQFPLRYSLLALAAALGLAGCDQRADSEVERGAATAANKAAELAETARDKTRAFATSPEVKEDAAALKDALRNAGSSAATVAGDAAITLSVSKALSRDPLLSASKIDVRTERGVVRLGGAVPSADARSRASELAGSVQGVTTVDNALEVRPG